MHGRVGEHGLTGADRDEHRERRGEHRGGGADPEAGDGDDGESSGTEVIGAAQLYLGVPFCSEDSADMKKVLDLLMAQKPFVAAYTSDNIENRIGGGEVAAHFWWDGNSMKTRMNDGAKIEFAMPKEGLVGWLDSFAVPKGAPNVDNAKAFIDFMSKVENATVQYNYYGHSAPVAIDTATAKYTPENAPELFPTVPVEFSRTCSPAAQDLVTKVWTQLLQ